MTKVSDESRGARRTGMVRMPLTAAIYIALSTVSIANAQEQAKETDEPAATAGDKTATLDAVQVTAQKRKENLQKAKHGVAARTIQPRHARLRKPGRS